MVTDINIMVIETTCHPDIIVGIGDHGIPGTDIMKATDIYTKTTGIIEITQVVYTLNLKTKMEDSFSQSVDERAINDQRNKKI